MCEINDDMIQTFSSHLMEEEKARATVKNYTNVIRAFYEFIEKENHFDKNDAIRFKAHIMNKYKVNTVNVYISALNHYFTFFQYPECILKKLVQQKMAFRPEDRDLTKEDYFKLLQTAKEQHKDRLYYVMETMASTGIRVSELPMITVESLLPNQVSVYLKGKIRQVYVPTQLRQELKEYANQKGITEGPVFVTKTGNPIHRSNIYRDMKNVGMQAGVNVKKIFPHNLRHLFALSFYEQEHDLARLADILGHSNINTTRMYVIRNSSVHGDSIESLQLLMH